MSTKEKEGLQPETTEIKKSIVINAAPEVVFKAITDPTELTHWFPDNAILEPNVGGKMKFSFYKTDSEYRQMDYFPEGTIIEFVPDKKISYMARTKHTRLSKNYCYMGTGKNGE
jgi:uncharacterized protein YndB with AHSA1/START domain